MIRGPITRHSRRRRRWLVVLFLFLVLVLGFSGPRLLQLAEVITAINAWYWTSFRLALYGALWLAWPRLIPRLHQYQGVDADLLAAMRWRFFLLVAVLEIIAIQNVIGRV